MAIRLLHPHGKEVAAMLAEASRRYSFAGSFDRAVESVCSSLRSRQMRVAGELDIADRLHSSLGIVLRPCKIVFVLPRSEELSAAAMHPWGAVFLPLHVVISGSDFESEIDVQNRVQAGQCAVAPTFYCPVVEAQRRLLSVIDAVAARPSLLSWR